MEICTTMGQKEFAAFVAEKGIANVAEGIECSAAHLRNVLAGRKNVSPELAIRIHQFSGGRVPGSMLRPELWRSPDDVPIAECAA